jgi:NADH dehydrogenase/NADH:ubiquinone oxidoreductase subunit G
MTRSPDGHAVVRLTIDGIARDARQDERLVDVITRIGTALPHVCYHPM